MVNSYKLTISQLAMDSFAYTQLCFPLSLTGIFPNYMCVTRCASYNQQEPLTLRDHFTHDFWYC